MENSVSETDAGRGEVLTKRFRRTLVMYASFVSLHWFLEVKPFPKSDNDAGFACSSLAKLCLCRMHRPFTDCTTVRTMSYYGQSAMQSANTNHVPSPAPRACLLPILWIRIPVDSCCLGPSRTTLVALRKCGSRVDKRWIPDMHSNLLPAPVPAAASPTPSMGGEMHHAYAKDPYQLQRK